MASLNNIEIIVEDEVVLPQTPSHTDASHTNASHTDESEKESVPHKKDDDLNIIKQVPSETHRRHYLFVFYASSAYCIKVLFQGSISPIADVLTEEYNVSLAAVGLLSSSVFLLALIFSIPCGIILQLVSYQKMLFVAWIGLIVSILLFGLCDSLIFGILLRGIAGLFGPCAWLIVIGFGAQHFGNNSVSVITALTICYTRTVSFAGVTAQAYIYQKYQSWREMYFVMAAIGIIIIIAYVVTILTSPTTDNTLDEDVIADDNNENNDDDTRIEIALQKYTHSKRLSLSLTPGPMDLQFPLFDVQQTEPTTTPAVETKAVSPPKKGNAFTNYLNWANCAIGCVIYALMDGVFGMWFIPYLMIKFNFDRVTASLIVGIGPWSHGFGALLIGYLAAKYKKRKIFLYFGTLCMSSIFVIIYMKDVSDFVICVVIILVGVGSGAYASLLFALTREYNARSHTEDSAAGLVNAFCIASSFVSQNLIGVLLDYHRSNIRNDHDLSDYKTDDYQFAFSIVLPTCIIIVTIATFILKETNGKNL